MTARRIVLLITGLVVAGLGAAFAVLRWDDANRVATVASALATVAALGLAVWAALPGGRPGHTLRVSHTGKAVAGAGGTAVSGVSGSAGSATGDIDVHDTGDAEASGGGNATSGVSWP